MTKYRIIWEIDIDADTPKEAAERARAAQMRPDTLATVFDVYERYGDARRWIKQVDLTS